MAAAPAASDALVEALHRLDRDTVGRIKPGITIASRLLDPSHPAREAASRVSADVLGVVGFADPSHMCAISFVSSQGLWRPSRELRSTLMRLSAHLASGWRARSRARPDEAVLGVNGAVLDAQGDARERGARERLREAVKAIAHAKRESRRDPAAGLAFWRAMVDGRWTLVERIDSDGRRFLVARENRPDSIASHALTPRERAVIERVVLGGTLRQVAYELGLAESTISENLRRALTKLGIRNRAELLELSASLLDDAP